MKVIITIHGIHTNQMKSWQTRFWEFAHKKDKDVKVLQYEYAFILAPFAWLMTFTNYFKIPSFLRSHLIKRFVAFINKVKKEFPDAEISIIAHSFGTWISYCALERDQTIKIKNLVLVAGVISSHIEKLDLSEWLEWGRINRVHAWSSHNDDVVCAKALPPFGKVGCRGFIRKDHAEDYESPHPKPYPVEIHNHHTQEKHGGVLDKLEVYGEQLVNQLLED